VQPQIGRGFAPGESGDGRPGVVVLGHELWLAQFGGDSSILGREILLDEEPFTVIGVMGRDFDFVRHSSTGPPERADAYITFAYSLAETDPRNGAFSALIRAKPGASPKAVQAQVASVGRYLDERDFATRGIKWYAVAAKEDLISDVRPALVVLGIAGAFLVLVLAVNLATLLLSRAVQREREFAVSRALGANPVALARATLLEGSLLGLLGGAGGALVALWGIDLLTSLAPPNLPRLGSIELDAGIAAFVMLTGASLGLAAGVLPAAWATRSSLTTLLSKAAVRGGGGSGGWMRRGLVVMQVALSLILLTTGGLVVKSFERLLQSQPGFVPDGVLTLRIPMSLARFPEEAQAIAMHERLQEAMRAVPGVTHVGATTALPLTAEPDQTELEFPGAPGNTGVSEHDVPLVDIIRTYPGLMPALSIPILQGQDFGPPRDSGYPEALIDRTLAEEFYPNGGATGSLILAGEDTLVVVGVVEHARQYDLHRDGRGQMYVRNNDYPTATMSWVIRSSRDPEAITPDILAAVRRVDPALAVADVRPLARIVDDALRQQRLSATLVGGFSLGALLLAAMGLFGVVSGAVTRRQHELAVRMALGAAHSRVLALVIREGAVLIGLGVLIAIPCIFFTGRAIRATLVGVSPFDPATLLGVVAGLTAVTLAACYLPARRVTVIQPASALRQD
jgi:putative ABC transport system permease protein